MTGFYIVDLRPAWKRERYITFWRSNNAGYAWPLCWAGSYSANQVNRGGGYYAQRRGRSLTRFAVPCAKVMRLAEEPEPGRLEGGVGPVVVNNISNRRKLRAAAINRDAAISEEAA